MRNDYELAGGGFPRRSFETDRARRDERSFFLSLELLLALK